MQNEPIKVPYSKENEMMVLGCMLNNEHNFKIASQDLDDSDFYCEKHKIIFQTLKTAYHNNKPADIHLMCEELKRQDKLESAGGAIYIATLLQYAGTSAYLEEYIKDLRNYSISRLILQMNQKAQRLVLENPENINHIIDECRDELERIERSRINQKDEILHIGEIIKGTRSQIDDRSFIEKLKEKCQFFKDYGKPFIAGIKTGFTDLDKDVIILEDTNLVIVAARPAMGKTALALNIASYICFDENMPVGIISLEMGRDQLLERLISSRTKIPGERIKRGTLINEEIKKIQEESERIYDNPFFIIDRGCQTIKQVVSIARKLKSSKDIKLLVLDYLQLLGTGGSSDSRQYEVAEISRSLKLLAMELKIPILCVAQLSRKVEERNDKRPLVSDLRDSGQIEQDADAILFIYRRSYYDKIDKPNEADLFLKKNRHGPETEIKLHFDKDCGLFADLASISHLKVGF